MGCCDARDAQWVAALHAMHNGLLRRGVQPCCSAADSVSRARVAWQDGPVFNQLVVDGNSRMCLFTGSQAIAEKLTLDLRGRVKLEDAGFDWKVLGPDVAEMEYVAWQVPRWRRE
jgi:hypothetical protein